MTSLPTTADDWRLLGRTVRLVLGTPVYGAVALVVAGLTVVLLSITQNLEFVLDVVVFGDLPLGLKLELLRLQLPFLGGGFGAFQGLLLYVTAALVGTSTATLVYHVREHSLSVRGGSGSTLAVALAALGAGCAACGPAILAGVIALTGATGIAALPLDDALASLPLHGLEFSLLAVGLLVLSTFWLAEGMRGGEIRGCPVDPRGRR